MSPDSAEDTGAAARQAPPDAPADGAGPVNGDELAASSGSRPAARRPGSPRARRGGTRRTVGPLIGETLAQELMRGHEPDVLLSGQCSCGMGFPCPSRLFATCFVSDEPVPSLERALLMSHVVLQPERWWPPAGPAPRHAVAAVAEEGRTEPLAAADRGRHATANGDTGGAEPDGGREGVEARGLPVDPDATQQLPKIPADSSHVAVAV